jgi:hypothetical protein
MPDPVSERAEYVVMARRGIAKLYLFQRGQWLDPGPVAVNCARPFGAVQAVTRWLGRIRRAVMNRPLSMPRSAHLRARMTGAGERVS